VARIGQGVAAVGVHQEGEAGAHALQDVR
jgi:hypothetical protein